MKNRSFRRALLAALLVPLVAIATAAPALADPASRTVVDEQPAWTAQAPVVDEAPAAAPQNLTVVLKLRDEAGAEALADAVSDPSSAQYRKFVSSADWRTSFAPTDEAVAKVTSWLTSQGFSIGAIPANKRFIPFSGSAQQAEAAFSTDLKVYDKNGQQTSAPASAVSVPTAIADVVAGVGGLDASATKTPLHLTGAEDVTQGASSKRADSARSVAPAEASPTAALPPPSAVFKNATPCSTYYGQKPATTVPQILPDPLTYAPCGYKPAQLRGAYGLDQTQGAGYDGRGTTVAIVDAYASPYILADAQRYASANDPQHPLRSYQFSQLLPTGYTYVEECGAPGWYGEETLDVEAVHATAPGANILYVGATSCQDNDILAAVNSIVDNQLAQVVSNSYGDTGEVEDPTGEEHQTYLQAAAVGISMLFSSGDNGDEVKSTGTRQVDSPASDPYVTAVGGTALAVGKTNNYLFEQGWGTGKAVLKDGAWNPIPPTYLYGGGGGTSRLFTQPSYQEGVVPTSISEYFSSTPHRAVPDVAMVGDPNTGFLVGQSQTFPNGTIKYSEYRIGGTSLSSPLFAGLVAVADQVGQGSLGFLNPTMYKLAGTPAFHDIASTGVTDGVVRVDYVNGVNAADGKVTSLRTLNQTASLATRPGYDDVTGLGTPSVAGLISAISGSSGHPGSVPAPTTGVGGHPLR